MTAAATTVLLSLLGAASLAGDPALRAAADLAGAVALVTYLLPSLPHEQVPALLAPADIFLVPLRDVPSRQTRESGKRWVGRAAAMSRGTSTARRWPGSTASCSDSGGRR